METVNDNLAHYTFFSVHPLNFSSCSYLEEMDRKRKCECVKEDWKVENPQEVVRK